MESNINAFSARRRSVAFLPVGPSRVQAIADIIIKAADSFNIRQVNILICFKLK